VLFRSTPYTTSDVSAGYWEPFCLNDDDPELKKRIMKWGKETYDTFVKQFYDQDANIYGVQLLSAYVLQKSQNFENPYWANAVMEYRRLSSEEFKQHRFGETTEAKAAFHFKSTTVEMSKYLPYMLVKLEQMGVRFAKLNVTSFKIFMTPNPENQTHYVVNCTGLGAGQLCRDEKVYPTRGVVLRVEAPWVKNLLMFDDNPKGCTYILPLSNLAVCGGTIQPNNYNTVAEEDECKSILDRCSSLLPSIKNAKIVQKKAGLRPTRHGGVRLELEVIKDNNAELKVIHNYGHGGSGITLSWGCASEAIDIIIQDLQQNTRSKL